RGDGDHHRRHQEERRDEQVERGGDVELECGAQIDGDRDAQPAHVHGSQQGLGGRDGRARGSGAEPLQGALRKPYKHNADIVLCRRAGRPSDSSMGGKYWKQCGKVQEQSAILWPMRHRLAGAILALALGAQLGVAQAPLTPIDSAILNSQPLKRLVLAPSLFRRLSVLAAGLDREVVLCLQGSISGDTAVARELVMPDLVRSTVDAVEPEPCAPTTLAVWHNHPWTGPDSSFGVRTPEDLCSLSQPDLRTVVADSIPFAVVSVGRTSRPIVCWWRRVQAVVNRHVKFLPRF